VRKFIQTALMMLLILPMAACWKITDPNDPRFDPAAFDFNDYKNHEELAEVLRGLFKPGDSREDVEKVLVEAGRVKVPHEIGKDKELKYPLGGYGGIPHTQYEDYKTKIENYHQHSYRTVLYQKQMKGTWSPAAWEVFVFYDSKEQVEQMMSMDILVFSDGEQE